MTMQQREILFRGKHIHTGEWIFGPSILFFPDGEVYIYPEDGLDSPDSYQVDPKTVCQYTGLQDVNGKKIFEGDIVNAYDLSDLLELQPSSANGVIVYSQNSFSLSQPNKSILRFWTDAEEYEIIGNIHDNPQMINQ